MPKTPIEMMMDGVEWIPVAGDGGEADEGLPYVTHEGVLDLGGVELKVYTLNDRRRIIDADSMAELLGIMEGLTDAAAGRTTPIAEVREGLRKEREG